MLQSLQQSQQAGGHVPVHLSPPSGYWGSVTCTHGSSQTWLILFLGLSQPSRHSLGGDTDTLQPCVTGVILSSDKQ